MAEYILKKMNLEHLDQVQEIEQASFSRPWSRSAFVSELIRNSFSYYLVACDPDEQVTGYGGMWVVLDEAHITTLAVHPRYRRRGIAGALLERLLAEALRRDVVSVGLEVRPSNVPARNLYEKFNFRVRSRRKKYYLDEDALVMWLDNPRRVSGVKEESHVRRFDPGD